MCRHPLIAASFWLAAAGATAAESPGLGVPLTPERIAAIELTVMPDGNGLPRGAGDAVAGAAVYEQHCRACHGQDGHGGPNDALVGGRGSLTSKSPLKTVGSYWPYATTLFDYVRRAMPYPAPGSLSADEVFSVTAYLLFENGIIEEHEQMNADTLPAVTMPNREGFRVPASITREVSP